LKIVKAPRKYATLEQVMAYYKVPEIIYMGSDTGDAGISCPNIFLCGDYAPQHCIAAPMFFKPRDFFL
jgi:hypothetical protein